MSAKPALADRDDALVENALRRLIDDHGHELPLGVLPWLGGIFGQVRHGFALRDDQIARVSALRGELARRHNGR